MKLLAYALVPLLLMACQMVLVSSAEDLPEVGGQKAVKLTRTAVSKSRPEFTSITVLPGRGMLVLQITANFPGKGNVDVLASPDLAEAVKILNEDDSEVGAKAWSMGSAFLVPYPNRIRGKLSADEKTLTTAWGRAHADFAGKTTWASCLPPSVTPCTGSLSARKRTA